MFDGKDHAHGVQLLLLQLGTKFSHLKHIAGCVHMPQVKKRLLSCLAVDPGTNMRKRAVNSPDGALFYVQEHYGPISIVVSSPQPFESDDLSSNPARSTRFHRIMTTGRLLTYSCLEHQIHSNVSKHDKGKERGINTNNNNNNNNIIIIIIILIIIVITIIIRMTPKVNHS